MPTPGSFSTALPCVCAALLLGAALARAQPPAANLTLAQALAAALRDNPTLAAGAAAVRAREGDAQQAGALPNPELKLELENFAGSGALRNAESAETTLRLSQVIELGGKRTRRLALAGLERDAAQWDVEVRRADVAADTARAFVAVVALQERVALAADGIALAARSADVVGAQVRAGGTAPVEAARARLAVQQAELEHAERGRELAAARLALAAQWGAASADFGRARGHLAALAPPPPLEPLLAAVARNPDLARWATELAAREAAIALQRARAVPDVALGAGPRYFSDTDDVGLVVELWVPLPLFDRNAGAIAAAEAELARADATRRASDVGQRAALARTHAALAAAYERAATLRDDLLPTAESVRAAVEAAHRQGALPSLDVLTAQQTQFALRDQYLVALAAYHQALADLERLAGGAVDGLAIAVEPPPARSVEETR